MTQQMIMLISSRRRWQSLFKAVCYGGIESSDLAKCFLQIIHRPIQKAFEECQKIIQLESDVSVLKPERRIKHAMSRRLLSKKHAAVQLTTKLLEEPIAKIVEIAYMQFLSFMDCRDLHSTSQSSSKAESSRDLVGYLKM